VSIPSYSNRVSSLSHTKEASENASQKELLTYKEGKRQSRLSLQGVHKINDLSYTLDQQGHYDRTLCVSVDGSYTNTTVLKKHA
jgi:hypothetical protein